MLSELGHEPSVVGVARLYAPIAGTLVIDPVDADLAEAIEAEGMRAGDHPVDHEQPRDRRGARQGLVARRPQPSERSPTLSSVHGAHARWIRARVGDRAKREMSLGRRGTVIGILGARAGHHRPQVADRGADARADVDDQPAAFGAGSHQRVDRVVDVQEVARLTPVTVDLGAEAVAKGVGERADHTTVVSLPRTVDGAQHECRELHGVIRPIQVEQVDDQSWRRCRAARPDSRCGLP